jgi:hypothetical protein
MKEAKAIEEIQLEHKRAVSKFGPFASAHEGYAVMLEEMDELWDEIKKSPANRDTQSMRNEAIQLAAMAYRFLIDIC